MSATVTLSRILNSARICAGRARCRRCSRADCCDTDVRVVAARGFPRRRTSLPSPVVESALFVNSTPTVADRGLVKSSFRSAP
jgi:hypothetical protein